MEYLVRNLSQEQTAEVYRQWIHKHFPQNEIKPLKNIIEMWDRGAYCAFGMYEQEKLIGYAFFVTAPESEMLLLDYFAIVEEYRSRGMGGSFLRELQRFYMEFQDAGEAQTDAAKDISQNIAKKASKAIHPRGILIETEDVEYAQNEEELQTRQKRDLFYRHNGAVLTEVKSEIYGVHYAIWNLPLSGQTDSGKCREQLANIYRIMVPGDRYEKFVSIHLG